MKNLQLAQEENTSLKEALSQEGKVNKMSQHKVHDMENQIHAVFQAISESKGIQGVLTQEKMHKIAHTMKHYKDQIKEMEESTMPTNIPEIRGKRERDAIYSAENIA
jgi:hypothetical protein